MAINAFKVLTEFRFDVAQAVVSSDALQKKVEGLSNAADEAVRSVENLGISFVMSFSGAAGGILGMLGKAIKSADKFRSIQVELANAMVQNRMTMGGQVMTFNQGLAKSDEIMGEIVKKAQKFNLSPDAFASQVKFFNNMLAPKGLAGDDMQQSIELARVSMKAAPALGVSNEQAIGGIMSGISGQLSKQTQFGTRLFMEAGDIIKQKTGIKNLKEFNKALPNKRIRALIVGLDKLAGSSDAVKARAGLLFNKLQGLKDLFFGIGSILKPLGEVIIPPLIKAIDFATKYLKTHGASLVRQMASIIKPLMDNPIKLFIGLKQISRLSNDVGTALAAGGMLIGIVHMKEMLHTLQGMKWTAGIGNFLVGIIEIGKKIPIISHIGIAITNFATSLFGLAEGTGILKAFFVTTLRLAGFLGILLIPLQGLSRAIERVKMDNALALANALPEMLHWLDVAKTAVLRFITPITDMIGGFEELFYLIIGGTFSVDGMRLSMKYWAETLDEVSMLFMKIWASTKAMIAGITAVVASISTGNFSELGSMFADAAREEFTKNMEGLRTPTLDRNGKAKQVAKNVVNQHINMNNNFKEVLQPDRIAFTIKDQLQKEARNATQTSGNVFGRSSMTGLQRASF
jgi:hypothetical protein